MATRSPRLPRLPKKFPRIDPDEFRARMERIERQESDKRCLRGEYAPKPGVCRVCGGKVTAEVSFHYPGEPFVMGGPPAQAHVSGWHCEDCKLVYYSCPPPR